MDGPVEMAVKGAKLTIFVFSIPIKMFMFFVKMAQRKSTAK